MLKEVPFGTAPDTLVNIIVSNPTLAIVIFFFSICLIPDDYPFISNL